MIKIIIMMIKIIMIKIMTVLIMIKLIIIDADKRAISVVINRNNIQ